MIITLPNAEQICRNLKENSSSVPESHWLWGHAWRACSVKGKRVMTQCCDFSEKGEENDDDNSDEGLLAGQWRLWWIRLGYVGQAGSVKDTTVFRKEKTRRRGWFRRFSPTVGPCLQITESQRKEGGETLQELYFVTKHLRQVWSLYIWTTTSAVHLMEQKWWADVEQRLWSRMKEEPLKHGTHVLKQRQNTTCQQNNNF